MTQSVSKDAVNATQITLVTAVQLADTLRAQRDAIAESLAASVLPLLDLRLHAEKLNLKEMVGELELKLGRARAALSSLNEYVLYSASAEQWMSHGGFWSHDCGWGAFETAAVLGGRKGARCSAPRRCRHHIEVLCGRSIPRRTSSGESSLDVRGRYLRETDPPDSLYP